jgi:hypothetical protein
MDQHRLLELLTDPDQRDPRTQAKRNAVLRELGSVIAVLSVDELRELLGQIRSAATDETAVGARLHGVGNVIASVLREQVESDLCDACQAKGVGRFCVEFGELLFQGDLAAAGKAMDDMSMVTTREFDRIINSCMTEMLVGRTRSMIPVPAST